MILHSNNTPAIGEVNEFGDTKTGECFTRDDTGSLYVCSSYLDKASGATYTEIYCIEDFSDEIVSVTENNELTLE